MRPAELEASGHLEQRAEVVRRVVLADHDPVGFDPGVGGEGGSRRAPTHQANPGTTALARLL
jgi:hypothetical protein